MEWKTGNGKRGTEIWEQVTDLDTPASKNDTRRKILLFVPQLQRGLCALCLVEYWRMVSVRRTTGCYFLLRRRVGDTLAIVRCEVPPGHAEEYCPEC